MTDYITIPEAALLWKAAPLRIRQACEMHEIRGAVRFGRSWLIPWDTRQTEAKANDGKAPARCHQARERKGGE